MLIEIIFNGDELFYFVIREHEIFGNDLYKSYDEEFHGSIVYYEALNKAIEESFKLI